MSDNNEIKRVTFEAYIDAAFDGDAKTVREFLAKNQDKPENITKKDELGLNALMYAASDGRIEIVEMLVNDGHFNVFEKNKNGLNAYDLAKERNHGETATLLLGEMSLQKESSDSQIDEPVEINPLVNAIINGDVAGVDESLRRGEDINEREPGDSKRTLLMFAIACQQTEIAMRLLAEDNIDVNATNRDNDTALILASELGNSKVVNKLIERGADLTTINSEGKTALMYAVRNGHTEVIAELVKGGANPDQVMLNDQNHSILMFAASNGNDGAVNALLAFQGIEVDRRDTSGKTVLHHAAENGWANTVALLIERGADIHLADIDGNTALTYAVKYGYADMVKLLLDHGADSKINDHDYLMLVIQAVKSGCNETANELCEKRDIAKLKTLDGKTAREIALASDDHRLLSYFNIPHINIPYTPEKILLSHLTPDLQLGDTETKNGIEVFLELGPDGRYDKKALKYCFSDEMLKRIPDGLSVLKLKGEYYFIYQGRTAGDRHAGTGGHGHAKYIQHFKTGDWLIYKTFSQMHESENVNRRNPITFGVDEIMNDAKGEFEKLSNITQSAHAFVELRDTKKKGQQAGIIMDEVRGENLYEFLHKNNLNAFSDAFVFNMIRTMSESIQKLHNSGYLHCDLKEGNMIIHPVTGEVSLIDFGAAYHMQPDRSDNGFYERSQVWTTSGYCPYEVRDHFLYSTKSDAYAVGVIINNLANISKQQPSIYETLRTSLVSKLTNQSLLESSTREMDMEAANNRWDVTQALIELNRLQTIHLAQDRRAPYVLSAKDFSQLNVNEKKQLINKLRNEVSEVRIVGDVEHTDKQVYAQLFRELGNALVGTGIRLNTCVLPQQDLSKKQNPHRFFIGEHRIQGQTPANVKGHPAGSQTPKPKSK